VGFFHNEERSALIYWGQVKNTPAINADAKNYFA